MKVGIAIIPIDIILNLCLAELAQALSYEPRPNPIIVKQALDQATAEAERVDAERQLAQENYDRQAYLVERNAGTKAALDTATRNLDALKQSLAAAKAEEESARTAYTSNVGGVNSLIAKARVELADAQFDLDQTTTRAAGPGFVTQVSLRPGMYVIPTQLRTAMLFINNRDAQLGGCVPAKLLTAGPCRR